MAATVDLAEAQFSPRLAWRNCCGRLSGLTARVVGRVVGLPHVAVSDVVGVNAVHRHSLAAFERIASDVDHAVAPLITADLVGHVGLTRFRMRSPFVVAARDGLPPLSRITGDLDQPRTPFGSEPIVGVGAHDHHVCLAVACGDTACGQRIVDLYPECLDLVRQRKQHVRRTFGAVQRPFYGTSAPRRLFSGRRAQASLADLADGSRWRILINDGRLPWWIFSARARVPGTGALDYLGAWRLLTAGPEASIARSWPAAAGSMTGSAAFAAGRPQYRAGARLRPAGRYDPEGDAAEGWGGLPASGGGAGPLHRLHRSGAGLASARGVPALRFGHRLRRIASAEGRASALDFGEEAVALAPGDAVILALPAPVAKALLPEITAPESFRAILNAHFKSMPRPAGRRSSASSAARWNGSSPSRTASRSPSAAPTG